MLIAVASKSGTEVDQHFGHADRFLLFEVSSEESQLVRDVEVEKYCSFDPDHPFRHKQFHAIVEALAGCRAVVTAKIGDYPKMELEKAGLLHVEGAGPIGELLLSVHNQLS